MTLSGDAPFESRMVWDRCEDKLCLSLMSAWVPDALGPVLNNLLKRHGLKNKDDLRQHCKPEVQADMIKNEIFSPTTTWYDPVTFEIPKGTRPSNFIRIKCPGDGYKTKIPLNCNILLPPQTLIFVENMTYVVPDGCHMTVRIVEKDLKLIAEFLLNRGGPRMHHFLQFQANICSRDIKSGQFRFKNKDGNNVQNANEIADISLCGRDARTIIADPEDLKQQGVPNVSGIFDGVLLKERPVPNILHRSIEILQELGVLDSDSYSVQQPLVPSELAIGNLLFHSHNNIVK